MLPPPVSRSPTRESLGTASLSISSRFVFSSGPKDDDPVTFPPGRARLVTKPSPTGSALFAITMGTASSRALLLQNIILENMFM